MKDTKKILDRLKASLPELSEQIDKVSEKIRGISDRAPKGVIEISEDDIDVIVNNIVPGTDDADRAARSF
ncbi:MAG: hypothetical protein ACOH5I_22605 [Oligoflexus sp.]